MTVNLKKLAGHLTFTSSLMLLAIPTLAEENRFGDKLTFSIGFMHHNGDGFVSSTREDVPIDSVTFGELDLDDDADILWASFKWRFFERWQFSLGYSSYDADGFNLADSSGNFDDIDWEAGAQLTSSLNLEFFIADVTYDVLQTDKGHVGLGVGVHAADLDFDLLVEAFGTVGGVIDDSTVVVGDEEASVLAPLPNLSLVGGYAIGKNVYVEGRAGYLSLSYDRYDGSLVSLRGAVEWRAWENVGLGAAYQFVDVDVDVEGSRSVERYDLDFHGPVLFLSVGF